MADTTLKEAAGTADEPKRSLVDVTLDRLIEMIIAAGAGASIPPQDALAKQFDVSRTVLREALVILVFLNVLTVRPKVGTRINPAAQWKVFNAEVLRWRLRTGETMVSGGLLDSARLNSAAPDMLAVLLDLTDLEGPLPGTQAWHGRAMAAIAKAQGVQS